MPVLPALRHRRCRATRSRRATRTSSTRRLRALPAGRRERGGPGESLLVWTTTPWTLPGNVAVAVAPDVEYVRARGPRARRDADAREPLVGRVLGEPVVPGSRRRCARADRDPRSLPRRRLDRPVLPRRRSSTSPTAGRRPFTVIAGDFVTTDDGTGIVHIAPAFGEDDFDAAALPDSTGSCREPRRRPTATRGEPTRSTTRSAATAPSTSASPASRARFVKDADVTAALDRRPRRPRPALQGRGLRAPLPALLALRHAAALLRQVELVHPHDRPSRTSCSPPTRTINWYPEHIKHGRFGNWLENNVDWALSRERYWGTPLPIWRSEDGEETICVGSRAELRELTGGELPDDLHRPYVDDVVFERGGKTFRRVPDVIDVWFDSGAMPFAQWHYPFENEDEFERASRPTTSARRSTRRAAGSTRCSRSRRC